MQPFQGQNTGSNPVGDVPLLTSAFCAANGSVPESRSRAVARSSSRPKPPSSVSSGVRCSPQGIRNRCMFSNSFSTSQKAKGPRRRAFLNSSRRRLDCGLGRAPQADLRAASRTATMAGIIHERRSSARRSARAISCRARCASHLAVCWLNHPRVRIRSICWCPPKKIQTIPAWTSSDDTSLRRPRAWFRRATQQRDEHWAIHPLCRQELLSWCLGGER